MSSPASVHRPLPTVLAAPAIEEMAAEHSLNPPALTPPAAERLLRARRHSAGNAGVVASPVRPGLAAVVAPYGSGRHYRDAFASRGWGCVAVIPADEALPSLYRGSLDPTGYRSVVVHDDNVQATAQALRTVGVTAVVAGTEIGVPLAEQLAHRLGLPGNDPQTSSRRRDKGAMAAALAAAGIAGPRSLSTDRLQDALAFAHSLDTTDVVLKPADSAGSDGVSFCSSPDEIRSAWEKLHLVPNAMGGSNQHLVIQERLQGVQYVVNSVSTVDSHGAPWHTVTEVWADRRTGTHLYDRLDLLPLQQPIPRRLAQYTERVLDALGITTGPAHTELMYVSGRGPMLIESGARPEGSYDPVAMREATGSDHIRDAVHAAVTGDPQPTAWHGPKSTVSKVSLIAPAAGALDADLLGPLLALPTLRGYVGTLVPGTPVRRTVDLLTSPGRLTLCAHDPRAIDEDYNAIRAIEAAGLYGEEWR
ncbi:ATP-grasp domain-containing protein [Streptomyces sp. NPDC058247]|uniref:ATP-grasp domain-containing protein n=1 Tax=Streptomyces sp. NPDC058247 TaxID=3346401 RepID=UPI0036E41710